MMDQRKMKRYCAEPQWGRRDGGDPSGRRAPVVVGLLVATAWLAGAGGGCGGTLLGGLPGAGEERAAVRIAEHLLAKARAAEPTVTAEVRELARRLGGRLFKPQYRLKTLRSLVRKIRTILSRRPGSSPGRLRIADVLRFTIEVADRPPGHYLRASAEGLRALERRGYRVVEVNNYWPRGDSYSGLNCVLTTRGGLLWELQLHTPASIRVNLAQRDLYEELRRTRTPRWRKRALFEKMASAWEKVPVPWGILVPGAVHPRARIAQAPRP